MAAEWLARLHNLGLQITPPSEFLSDEPLRLERYLSAFYKVDHPHTRKAQEIMDRVIETENGPNTLRAIFSGRSNSSGREQA